MGVISQTGWQLATLDTVRADDERRLAVQIAALSAAVDAKEAAEKLVASRLRDVLATTQRIAEATGQMQQLISGSKP